MIIERTLRRQEVEDEAYRVLAQYATKSGDLIAAPVDVDLIAELLFDLRIDWDEIEEPLDKFSHIASHIPASQRRELTILGGLYPRSRRIVLNEKHATLFTDKKGLERFTKAHEVGHWVLHIDHAVLAHPTLSLFDDEPVDHNNSAARAEAIICRDGDDTWIERQANWFAAGLLLPKELLLPATAQVNLGSWNTLYALAEQFDVTISALVTRLQQFGLIHVDGNSLIVCSAAEVAGQMRLRR